MSTNVSIETASRDLKQLVEQLRLGETLTLVDREGAPVAILVSLKPKPAAETLSPSEWMARWDALTQEISAAWKSEKGAVETLLEMRR